MALSSDTRSGIGSDAADQSVTAGQHSQAWSDPWGQPSAGEKEAKQRCVFPLLTLHMRLVLSQKTDNTEQPLSSRLPFPPPPPTPLEAAGRLAPAEALHPSSGQSARP